MAVCVPRLWITLSVCQSVSLFVCLFPRFLSLLKSTGIYSSKKLASWITSQQWAENWTDKLRSSSNCNIIPRVVDVTAACGGDDDTYIHYSLLLNLRQGKLGGKVRKYPTSHFANLELYFVVPEVFVFSLFSRMEALGHRNYPTHWVNNYVHTNETHWSVEFCTFRDDMYLINVKVISCVFINFWLLL